MDNSLRESTSYSPLSLQLGKTCAPPIAKGVFCQMETKTDLHHVVEGQQCNKLGADAVSDKFRLLIVSESVYGKNVEGIKLIFACKKFHSDYIERL